MDNTSCETHARGVYAGGWMRVYRSARCQYYYVIFDVSSSTLYGDGDSDGDNDVMS